MPGLKIITQPATEPVSENEIILRTGVDTVSSDDVLSLIRSARIWCENFTGRKFITQTCEIALDAFPYEITLLPNVQSIISVKYINTSGVEETIPSGNYVLDNYSEVSKLYSAYDLPWPNTREISNTVKVRFQCGYGTAPDVPEPIKAAIILIVGQSMRGQPALEASLYPTSIPNAAKELLQNYRILSI